jgi:hypothetical protein
MSLFPPKTNFIVLKNVITGDFVESLVYNYTFDDSIEIQFTADITKCMQFIGTGSREEYMNNIIRKAKIQSIELVREAYTRVVSYVKDEIK